MQAVHSTEYNPCAAPTSLLVADSCLALPVENQKHVCSSAHALAWLRVEGLLALVPEALQLIEEWDAPFLE